MKDIVISGNIIRRQIIIYLLCFAISFFINVGAVICYNRPLTELFSQIGFVIVISIVFYALTVIVQLLIESIRYLLRRKQY